MSLLQVKGLVKYYGRRPVVNGVDFEVSQGEVVGLLGPNGAGKTTSFRMATGQLTPSEGTVCFNGEDVTSLAMYQRARLGMGYLPQESSVFRKLNGEGTTIIQVTHSEANAACGHRTIFIRDGWIEKDEVVRHA